MISVVFSTKEDNPKHIEHIKKTSGLVKNIEVIQYINDGEFSLTEIYNKGLNESKYKIVAFIHDDLILPKNWGKKMLNHFNNSDYGILGVAGTTDLLENGQWWSDTTKMVGIVKHSHNGKTWENKYSASFGKDVIETVIVDGLFFMVDKNKIKDTFSEDVKGFHFYDIDFTFKNHINGVKVGVVFDVRLIHKSIGQTNQEWENNRIKFVEKYKDRLPQKIKPDILYENKVVKLHKKPKLSVIIPTKGNVNLLTDCITSLFDKDGYENMVVYIADTGSNEEEIKEINNFIENHTTKNRIKLIEYNYYNFAKINNDVVNNHISDDTEIILFCNNDIKLLNNGITQMVNVYNKNKKSVGTIGARLHFGDNTIQHAGIISWVNPQRNIEISHLGLRSYYNYNNFSEVIGNTGAFLMISKELFQSIGGFNENYIECFEDVELNLQCLIRNKKNYFVGDSVCYHYESVSRGKSREAINRLQQDYKNNLLPFIINNKKIHNYIKGLNNN